MQETPPELSSDIIDNGITLTGGSSLLRNLDELVFRSTGVKARVADDALLCVAKGAGLALDHLDTYKKALSPRGSFMHPILKAHIEKREFSHAYLLCGDGEVCRKIAEETARAILSEKNLESNPDFSRRRFGLFGINDSHNLTSWAATKSFSGQGKVFVMEVFSFNMESSNALLKTLEEPGEKIHFFIIVSSVETVMPTLRSRLTIIDLRLGSSASKSDLEPNFQVNFSSLCPTKDWK